MKKVILFAIGLLGCGAVHASNNDVPDERIVQVVKEMIGDPKALCAKVKQLPPAAQNRLKNLVAIGAQNGSLLAEIEDMVTENEEVDNCFMSLGSVPDAKW